MNSVILLGNLGQTPQLRHVNSGKSVLNFSLAVNSHKASGNFNPVGETNWFDITVWGANAEHQARYLTKGSKIIVQGELNLRHYVDRDGNHRQKTEIIAKAITWVNLKTEESAETTASA
jgi:single-strand DNA-binding protein